MYAVSQRHLALPADVKVIDSHVELGRNVRN